MDFKDKISESLKDIVPFTEDKIKELIEIPPDQKMGDYAFPCFLLSKELKKSPNIIAEELSKKIILNESIISVTSQGPYINFFINKNKLAQEVIRKVIEEKGCYGSSQFKKELVMIEYPAPNTNKPLHLGHVRNLLLGSSISNILAFAGYQSIPVDLVNDRGIHICKSMLAYKKWGKEKEPDKKTDHFVGDYYVLYSKKEKELKDSDNKEELLKLESETKDMLLKWENNDKETINLWKKMRAWALDGFKKTYELYGAFHKQVYYESEIYSSGKEIILEGVKKGVFEKKEDGAIIIDLTKEGLGEKVLLRNDGTSVYMTQDIFLAKKKFDDYKMDRSIYVVGNEQIYHFQVLFKVLEKLGFSFAKKCHHLSYGMISLPEGKMKSREGKVVDADDIAKEIKEIAKEEITKRHQDLKKEEIEQRAKVIGMGALKFFILKYDPAKDFTYNPKESISFEGETGPYVQYAHARICSILKQAKSFDENIIPEFDNEKEFLLVKKISKLTEVVTEAANNYKPSLIARYCIELAQSFNEFYQECPILKEKGKTKDSRLALILATRITIQNSLGLLGIQSPEEM